jgi:hypothetical protein
MKEDVKKILRTFWVEAKKIGIQTKIEDYTI